MTKDEALKLALEALEADELDMVDDGSGNMVFRKEQAITAIKEAQPEQEPVAWWNDTGTHIDLNVSGRGTPLYTHPLQRTWVGLTDEDFYGQSKWQVMAMKYAEAKLKEKNA